MWVVVLSVSLLHLIRLDIRRNTYHTEGVSSSILLSHGLHFRVLQASGGVYAPDIIVVRGLKRVLLSSTNLTCPHATNILDEHHDISVVHPALTQPHLNSHPQDAHGLPPSRQKHPRRCAPQHRHDINDLGLAGDGPCRREVKKKWKHLWTRGGQYLYP